MKNKIRASVLALTLTLLLTGCNFTIGTPGVGWAWVGTDQKNGTRVYVTFNKALKGNFWFPDLF